MQCTQSPQVLPSGKFIWSALSADRGKGALCSLMNVSVDFLVHLYSSTHMPPAGCRWARGRSADVIEVVKGAQARYWRRPGFAASSVLASYPPLIAGLAVRLRGWASSFLLTASNSICSPWITGPYNMHATALSALIEWGRVHEVRRSQPKLSGPLILEFGVSPICRWDSRGALLAGSFVPTGHTRFWRFTIEQPYKVFPVVGRLSGLSARRSPVEAMRSVVCCADF